MANPIVLTEKMRGLWAKSPSDVSSFLSNVITYALEAVSESGIEKNPLAHQNQQKILPNILNLFSPENSKKLAIIGASFRAQILVNPPLVTISRDDEILLNEVLQSMEITTNSPMEFIKSYASGRNPREAHVRVLTDLIFLGVKDNLLTNNNNSEKEKGKGSVKDKLKDKLKDNSKDKLKEKYQLPVENLLIATLNIVEFMNTPFAVLAAEVEADKDRNSGIDLQWSSMLNALIAAVDEIGEVKTKPTESMQSLQSKIKEDRLKFQGAFGIANAEYEMQKKLPEALVNNEQLQRDYQVLYQRYTEIALFVHELKSQDTNTPFSLDDDMKPVIRQYGERWRQSYDKLQQKFEELGRINQSLQQDAETQSLNLQHQIKELKEEITLQLQQIEELQKEIKLLQQQVEAKDKEAQALNQELVEAKRTIGNQQADTKLVEEIKALQPSSNSQPIISWIKNLLQTIQDLLQGNQKLQEENLQLQRDNALLREQLSTVKNQEELPIITLVESRVEDQIKLNITVRSLTEIMEDKFKNTNSDGVIELIKFMKGTQSITLPEADKLSSVSQKMREIATKRKDSSWSKSHFFGNGRHQGAQELYDLLASKDFSLNSEENVQALMNLLQEDNKQFTHNNI